MESLLSAMQSENKMLKETIIKQDSTILELRERVNNLEQHGRSFSIRVNNLPLEANEECDPPSVIKKVYNSVLLPILQGAAAQ
jgi:hypothetical protein